MTDSNRSDAPAAGLGDVLTTENLTRRPRRPPDLEAENRALLALAHELAVNPDNLLQKLVETVIELCHADSAGISIYVPGEGPGIFRWDAVAGQFADIVGGSMPRGQSPCDTVIDQEAALLFERPARHFTALADVQPEIVESLLVPFHAGGRPVGTLWAIGHTPERQFDAEDARLLTSLSQFASAGYQFATSLAETATARDELEERVQERTHELARELAVRERAERALRQSEERRLLAIEAAGIGDWTFHVSSGRLELSPRARKMLRADADEPVDLEEHDRLIHPEDRTAVQAARQSAIDPEGDGRYQVECRFLFDDGEARWIESLGRAAFEDADEGRRVTYLLGAMVDITERKRTEEALRESEARFRAVADLVPDLLWRADRSGMRTWGNQRWMEYSGQTLEEAVGYGWADTIHPDDCDRALRAYREAIDTGEPFRHEHRLRKADGDYRWFLVRAVPVRDDTGTITQWFGAATDVHDQRTAMETLEEQVQERTRSLSESEARFRALVTASAQIVWTTNAEGEVVEDSPSWRAFTGRTFEPWKGQGWADVIHPEDRASVTDNWQQSLETGAPLDVEFRLWHAPSVAWRWVHAQAVPLHDEVTGAVRGWVGMNVDIDERKQAEQQLRKLASRLTMAEQEERRRISQILHDDLQQLLYGIDMKMSTIRQDLQETEHPELMADLEEARLWVEQAITTTRQLTVDLSPPILQNEGLVDALEWLQRQMKELHGLDVAVEAEHPFLIPDEDLRVLLFQIVRELLFNVKKHAGVERATVELTQEAEYLVIHVIDEGQGFDVKEVAAREEQAEGFGLLHARERLRLLGGRLEVRSQPGEGMHVEVHAPVLPEPPA